MKLTFETFQIFDNIVWKRFYDVMKHFLTFFIFLLLSAACHGQEQRPFDGIDYPFAVQYADLQNGQTIAYHDTGSGDNTLVLIHGLGSYMSAWSMNIDALSKSNRVIALDLPGYGKSTKTAETFSIPFFAESVAMLMDELDIDNATILGHSMGGHIALYLAAKHPNRVEQLVLSAPAGFEQFTEQDKMAFGATVSPEAIAMTPEPMIRQNMLATFHSFPSDAEFMIEDRLQMKDEPGFEDYAEAQAGSIFAMLEEPVWEMMPDIGQPTLVIFGRQDALIPNRYLHPGLTTEDVAKTGTERLLNAELKLIDEAGHFVHFERADEFNRMVMDFLDE